jgi:hypothetical protein
MRKNSNSSNFHYRVEFLDEQGDVISKKWFHTLPQICEEYETSNYFLYNNMKRGIKIKNHPLMRVFNDYKPVYLKILNETQ